MTRFSRSAMKLASTAFFSAAALAGMGAAHQAQAAQVGVQVSVHQPGFHGRIAIGDQPPPPVIYQQPVIVQQSPVVVVQQPIYMNVPRAHYQHWARHCGYWRACGQPVYFVQPGMVYQGEQRAWRHEERVERWADRREERRERFREWREEREHGRHGHHGRD
ncbi:MAG: hypothetical protein RJB60_1363 [Pseudomonadota bacterium]|jgi:hypothetical protein